MFPADGEYVANISDPIIGVYLLTLEFEHTFVLTLDGEVVYETTFGGEDDLRAGDQLQMPAVDAINARFKNIAFEATAGPHTVGATFIQKTFAESDDLLFPQQPGEGLDDIPVVVRLEILGPFNSQGAEGSPSRAKIFSCYPDDPSDAAQARACAESIMGRLAEQAFRRPVGHAEVATLMGFYDAGYEAEGFETGVRKRIMAFLGSTKFLYRREEPPEDVAPGVTFALSDIELASRLSFFLWSEGPDEELLALAESGELSDPAVREAQVRRMLADPRAQALVTNFAYQWLDIESAASIDPDPRLFPAFDPDLRESFMRELELFIGSVLLEDQSVVRLLDAGHPYAEISRTTGASTATVTRIAQWLNHGTGGYREALDRQPTEDTK